MVTRFRRELGGDAKVVGTGGLVGLIEESKVIDIVDNDLVLTGLRLLYEMNERPGKA